MINIIINYILNAIKNNNLKYNHLIYFKLCLIKNI